MRTLRSCQARSAYNRAIHCALRIAVAVAICITFLGDSKVARAQNGQTTVETEARETQIAARWRQFRLSVPGSDGEDEAFEQLVAATLTAGVTNVPAYSTVLLRDAYVEHQNGRFDRARALFEWALVLSPESAQPQFLRAQMEFDESPLGFGRYIGPIRAGYRQLQTEVDGRIAVALHWRTLLLWFLGLLGALFLLAMVIRHSGLLAHDLRLVSGGELSLPQARGLVAVLIAAPAIVFWSPIVLVVTIIIVVASYLSWSERVLALGVLASLAATPFITEDIARLEAVASTDSMRVSRALHSPCDARCRERLTIQVNAHGEPSATLALAWAYYRLGDDRSLERAAVLLSSNEYASPWGVPALTLQGALAFAGGDTEAAGEAFEQARELSDNPTQEAASVFNLSTVARAEGRYEDARSIQSEAAALDPDGVERYNRYAQEPGDLYVINPPVSAEAMLDELLAAANPGFVQELENEMYAPWVGQLAASAVIPLCGAGAIWLVLSLLLRRRHVVSIRCGRCATPTSAVIYRDAYDKELCILCYQLSTVSRQLTPVQRDARKKRIEKWNRTAPVMLVFTNVVVPGAGLLIGGRTWLGLIVTVMVVFGAVLLGSNSGMVAVPYSVRPDHVFDARQLLGGLLLGVGWFGSIGLGYMAARSVR